MGHCFLALVASVRCAERQFAGRTRNRREYLARLRLRPSGLRLAKYGLQFDTSEVFNPLKALRRVAQGGRGYWHAWLIALAALGVSFLGLLGFGVGFLVTSVWFWQVAGFSFATVFSQRFDLHRQANDEFT